MESSRGLPGPEAALLDVAELEATVFRGGPDRTPSKPPSGLRVSGEEEAEDVGGASRHLRASSKASSGSIVHRPEREAWEVESGPRAMLSGSGSRRGTPGREHDSPSSSRHRDPEPPEGKPASERVCRRGSPGGGEMNVEQLLKAEQDNDEEAKAAFRAGRSPLELEGTVSRHGDLTHFVANNLQLKIRLSGAPSALPTAPVRPCLTPAPTPTIPPIDPEVLRDLERLSRELGSRVDRLLRGLGGAVQELTALSVGCIQTYRDAVDSLGEAVDMSIKGMYTLLARCEELERALQPVQGLARQVRDIRRTLEVLEALCK
ncbi:hypothetical protein H920_19767 [Fukomys damarensis]|uniref:BLOC-1-related complex subunit 6 C-terminal helix domain-containing protein n=1 Tax=Fukomys damarensis TaxID=885580 RepID=A0A091CN04_FUKDA|nr:hypothetical protein H920_19767 [Fukomys damarensis]